LLFKST